MQNFKKSSVSHCFAGLNKLLATLPAYSPRSKQIVQQNIQYTARELGVTDTTTKFPSSLNAKAACLIDADSGMVLFAKNADGKDVSDSVCLRKPE